MQFHENCTKESKLTSNLELQDCSASDDDFNKLPTEDVPHLDVVEGIDTKPEVDTVSCYCSASHTDNISTDEHDSLRDSHIGHTHFKGLHSSDSGTDLTESKHDYESAWQKYWSLHGETIIWKSWIDKYSAYINPDYLDYSGKVCTDCEEQCSNDCAGFSQLKPAKSTRFSYEEKDIEEHFVVSDSTEKQDLASKNRMLIRNLSGSDSYDKLHTDISEGWNPLSPASVEYETEAAERLLSSRCGSHASSSHRTVDSMTNVTRMTISSIDLSQSSKSSDSFSSVSSVQTSFSSSSSEDIEDTDFGQQWNVLWKKHYEEEYLKQYNKFIFSSNPDFNLLEKKNCIATDFETLSMAETAGIDTKPSESDVNYVEESLCENEMLALGLPTTFGSLKQSNETETPDNKVSSSKKRRLEEDEKTDEASVSKMKASFTLMGMEYQDSNRPKFVGTVEYRKKNIRFQNRQLKINKRPKHIHFDDDGNAIPSADSSNLLQQSSGSSDLKDTCSSSSEQEELEIKPSLVPSVSNSKNETLSGKRRRRKKKIVLPAEIKENPYLKRYWYKRFSLFSKFDEGIQLDEESWFSVTPEAVAKHHAERFKHFKLIVDGFCGVGGNTIQFAAAGLKVIAIDIDPQKIQKARHNAKIYGVEDKIEFITADFLELASTLKADAVFLSPPWGGPKYLKQKVYELEQDLQPVSFTKLMSCAKKISNNIGAFLPRNSNTHALFLSGLGGKVDIEQNFLNDKLIALTVYYNDLIH